METVDYALRYARLGWHVLPLIPGDKTPACKHGVLDATLDETTIRDWWTKNPACGIGIAAGKKSGIIVVDIDPRNGGNRDDLVALYGPIPATVEAITGGGGVHILFGYVDGVTSRKLSKGVDLLSDGRYFAVEPTLHPTGNRYEWEGMSDPLEGVAVMAAPERWLNAMREQKAVKQTVENSLVIGSRDNALTALGGQMRHFGMSEQEILAALEIANENRCNPPLPASDIRRIARSVSRYEPEYHAADAGVDVSKLVTEQIISPYNLLSIHDMLKQPPSAQWLVKGYIPDNGLVMVHGAAKSFKTFVVLDMLCHIASGRPWRGNKVTPGCCVILAGEGHRGLRSRVKAWTVKHGTEALNLFVSDRGMDLNTSVGLGLVMEQIDKLDVKPTAICVDTVHRHMVGNENSAEDVGSFLKACGQLIARYQCSVILIHHTGNNEENQLRARGSSAWRGALDAEFSVKRTGALMDKTAEMQCVAMKDSEESEPLGFGFEFVDLDWRDDDGQIICTLVPYAAKIEKDPYEVLSQKTIENIKTLYEAGGIRGVLQEEWRKFFYEKNKSLSKDAKKKAFQRMLKDLMEKDYVVLSGNFYVLNMKNLQIGALISSFVLVENA